MSLPHLLVAHPTIFQWDEVQRFEREILSNPRATELDASEFFHRFPKFLLLGQGSRLRREVVFVESESGQQSRVDFFRQNFGEIFWDIIVLKKPHVPAFVREDGQHPRPASIVYDAINQAEDYRTLIDTELDIRKQLEAKGISVFRPKIFVVVGRSPEDMSPVRLRDLHDRLSHGTIEFWTYDDIFNFAKEHYRATSLTVLPVSVFAERSKPFYVTTEDFISTLTSYGGVSRAVARVCIEAIGVVQEASPGAEYGVSSWRGNNRFHLDVPAVSRPKAFEMMEAVELAAMGVGLYSLASECRLVPVARAERGTYGDYLMRPLEYATDNLHTLGGDNLAAVKISGILHGGDSVASLMLHQYVRQMSASRTFSDKIVVVVDFKSHKVLIRRA